MRTAKLLKLSAYGVFFVGMLVAAGLAARPVLHACIVGVVCAIIFCLLRTVANVAQIVFECQSELFRVLGCQERSAYRLNATLKEVRDLMELKGRDSSQ